MDYKEILGFSAGAVALYSYIPYFLSMYRGQVRPHAFSWFIWSLLTFIGFAAQVMDGAGPGALVTGISACCSLVIAVLAVKYGEKYITRSDWATFIAGLFAIPLWVITDDPLWSVVLITVIDALGFWPTFRKSWFKPGEESLQMFSLSALKYAMGVAALAHFSWVSALYPASLVVMNGAFVAMVLLRRRVLSVA